MKTFHTFLTSVFCFVFLASYGQTEKGTFLLGSALKFSSSKTKSNTTTANTNAYSYSTSSYEYKQISVSIDPNVAYFVADRLAIGLITPYSYFRTKRGDAIENANSYSIGPVVRYYFPLGSRWAIFPEVSYSYGWTWMHGPYASLVGVGVPTTRYYSTTETTTIFHGGLGGVYFLNKSVGLEGKIYYQSVRNSYDDKNESDPVVVRSKLPAISLSFGVQVYFSRKSQ